jgi:hypothetical protein
VDSHLPHFRKPLVELRLQMRHLPVHLGERQ